jgi:5-methylcytosine-specific restriction enzyme subunit McrC
MGRQGRKRGSVPASATAVIGFSFVAWDGRARPTGFPNADIYQMHAYCTALGLTRGFVIYAMQGGEESRTLTISRGGPKILVRALDVKKEPTDLLGEARALAAEML